MGRVVPGLVLLLPVRFSLLLREGVCVMGRRRKVVLPDGLVHVVCVVIDGVLSDPVVCVDSFDAAGITNQVVVGAQANPGRQIIVGTFKVAVVPEGREQVRGG